MRKKATAVSLSVLAGVSALSQHKPQQRVSRAPGILATALLCATALSKPNLAYAGPHGGGGGFQGGGGFHSDGFHGGGFHGGRFGGVHASVAGEHNGFGDGHGGHWHHRWHNGGYGWWWGDGLGWGYYPYTYGWDGYPDNGYYNYSPPYAGQSWYYCSDPAGYYPYVSQCNTGWQTVPAH